MSGFASDPVEPDRIGREDAEFCIDKTASIGGAPPAFKHISWLTGEGRGAAALRDESGGAHSGQDVRARGRPGGS